MKVPKLTPMKSSNLAAMGFGDGLFIKFQGGVVYQYPDVPKKVYYAGLTAESPGAWFRSHIRGKFAHKRLDDGKPDAG